MRQIIQYSEVFIDNPVLKNTFNFLKTHCCWYNLSIYLYFNICVHYTAVSTMVVKQTNNGLVKKLKIVTNGHASCKLNHAREKLNNIVQYNSKLKYTCMADRSGWIPVL